MTKRGDAFRERAHRAYLAEHPHRYYQANCARCRELRPDRKGDAMTKLNEEWAAEKNSPRGENSSTVFRVLDDLEAALADRTSEDRDMRIHVAAVTSLPALIAASRVAGEVVAYTGCPLSPSHTGEPRCGVCVFCRLDQALAALR